jgi:lipopolysaccharide transport system ATP-binding protein
MVEKDSAYLTHKHHSEIAPHERVVAPEIVDHIPNIDRRFGDRRGEVIGIAVLDGSGQPVHLLEPSSTIVVRISVRANEDILLPIVGFMLRNHLGLDFAGTNTSREGAELPPMTAGDIYTVDFHVQLPELYPSAFSFSPAIADGTLRGYKICDWIDNAIALHMSPGDEEVYGHVHLPCRVQVNRSLTKSPHGTSLLEQRLG